MAEYIDREAAIRAVRGQRGPCRSLAQNQMLDRLKVDVERIPAADVAPVVHGKWEYISQTLNTLSQLRCSFCGWWSLDPSIDGAYNYCPNCGAKMDGGADDAVD